MKAYGLTQYHQVSTNTAYFPVILHFLHHRYVFVCTMPIQAHFLGIRLHSFSGPLHLLGARANTHPSPSWLFLTLFLFLGKRLPADNTWGTGGNAQKHVFRPRGYQFVETNYVTPNEQLSTEQLVFFCHQQCYYNSFKGYQNCLVKAGLLGIWHP